MAKPAQIGNLQTIRLTDLLMIWRFAVTWARVNKAQQTAPVKKHLASLQARNFIWQLVGRTECDNFNLTRKANQQFP